MKEIAVQELNLNPFTKFANDWPLTAAGTKDGGFNAMTVSWGGMGALWKNGGGLPVVTVYIRPQRYTKVFMDREDYFSVSFLPKEFKKQLAYIGSHSGRDSDKIAEAGLTPAFDENTGWFEEAEMVLICRKLYHSPLKEEGFCDEDILNKIYPERDFHDIYIGEVTKVLVK